MNKINIIFPEETQVHLMTSLEMWIKNTQGNSGKQKLKDIKMYQIKERKNKCFKIFYFIGCIGYFSGCLYQTWSFLDIYFKYPTTMEVNVFQEPVVEFPAVTVCNGNK